MAVYSIKNVLDMTNFTNVRQVFPNIVKISKFSKEERLHRLYVPISLFVITISSTEDMINENLTRLDQI